MILQVDHYEGDTVVVGETWCSESERMLSESKSVSERDYNDYELAPSLAKKRCSTPSEQSATSFAINSWTTITLEDHHLRVVHHLV